MKTNATSLINDNFLTKISYKEAHNFYSQHHYIGTAPICPFHLAEFEKGLLTQVASFGFSISQKASEGIWKHGNNNNTLELRRLTSISDRKNAESSFIAKCLKYIKRNEPHIKLILTYADKKVNHKGIIYQASNFIYLGLRGGNTIYYPYKKGKIHSRTAQRWKETKNPERFYVNFDKKISDTYEKHLYVKILGNTKFTNKVLSQFKIKPLPYPKQVTLC